MNCRDITEIKRVLNIDPKISIKSNSNIMMLLNDVPEDSTTEPELLDVLYSYIRSSRPHTIVEIGTYKGISTFVFSEALRENNYGKVYTIDNGKLIGNETAKKLFEQQNLKNIVFIEKESMYAFEAWGRAEIDFLYIDGDHSYTSSCIDFALWSRLLTKKGMILES